MNGTVPLHQICPEHITSMICPDCLSADWQMWLHTCTHREREPGMDTWNRCTHTYIQTFIYIYIYIGLYISHVHIDRHIRCAGHFGSSDKVNTILYKSTTSMPFSSQLHLQCVTGVMSWLLEHLKQKNIAKKKKKKKSLLELVFTFVLSLMILKFQLVEGSWEPPPGSTAYSFQFVSFSGTPRAWINDEERFKWELLNSKSNRSPSSSQPGCYQPLWSCNTFFFFSMRYVHSAALVWLCHRAKEQIILWSLEAD